MFPCKKKIPQNDLWVFLAAAYLSVTHFSRPHVWSFSTNRLFEKGQLRSITIYYLSNHFTTIHRSYTQTQEHALNMILNNISIIISHSKIFHQKFQDVNTPFISLHFIFFLRCAVFPPFQDGIHLLQSAPTNASVSVAPALQRLQRLRLLQSGRYYLGSPMLALQWLRRQDEVGTACQPLKNSQKLWECTGI